MRKDYVDLIDETTEGVKPDARERYEMAIDTDNYSADYPLQWGDFEERVIPGIGEVAAPCRSRCGSTTTTSSSASATTRRTGRGSD